MSFDQSHLEVSFQLNLKRELLNSKKKKYLRNKWSVSTFLDTKTEKASRGKADLKCRLTVPPWTSTCIFDILTHIALFGQKKLILNA